MKRKKQVKGGERAEEKIKNSKNFNGDIKKEVEMAKKKKKRRKKSWWW